MNLSIFPVALLVFVLSSQSVFSAPCPEKQNPCDERYQCHYIPPSFDKKDFRSMTSIGVNAGASIYVPKKSSQILMVAGIPKVLEPIDIKKGENLADFVVDVANTGSDEMSVLFISYEKDRIGNSKTATVCVNEK